MAQAKGISEQAEELEFQQMQELGELLRRSEPFPGARLGGHHVGSGAIVATEPWAAGAG